ncbi:MAG: hypothetical protein AAF944_00195 [Bacteroidota bacterium]
MKAFRYFLLFVEVTVSISFLLIVIGYLVKPHTDTPDQQTILSSLTFTENSHPSDPSTKQVSIYDLGLQMVQGTYSIPADWLVQQYVYTSPNNYSSYNYGYSRISSGNRFLVSFNGSQGEIIRCQDHYGNYEWGKATNFEKFESEADSLCQVGLLSHVADLKVSEFSANDPTEAKYLNNYVKIDSMYQYLEAPFTGVLEGKNCEGIVRLLYSTPASSVNMVRVIVTLAPEGRLSEVLETENKIAFSYQANPAHERYQLNTSRPHQQFIDQIDDYDYIPESSGWHPDSTYDWEKYQNWERVTPNY